MRRYHRLRRGDGTLHALTGPAADDLQDGASVAVAGQQSGEQFSVQQAQELSPPSAAERASRAAAASQVEGMLTIAHGDDFAGGKSVYHYRVHDDAGGVTALSVTALPTEIRGGSRVRISGRRSADGTALTPDAITILAAPSGGSTSDGMIAKAGTTNSVLVILANFNNTATPGYSAAQAQQVMVSNSNSVGNFFNEASYGGQLLNVTVTSSWVTMNLGATCSYTSIASAANAAAQALNPAYTASNYNFVVYLFTGQSCGWAGLAYVGYPHQAFINGTGSFTTQVIAHEMGHNFGLLHAGSLSCGSASIGGTCSVAEYGDPWDTMGNQRAMHYNARQKSLLGWIPASSVKTHSSGSASYTLSPLETAGGATYTVKIPTTNSNRTYWIEFRQPIGFDAPLASYPTNGVQVRVSSPFEWSSGSDDTEIVDMTPGSGGGFGDSALLVGQSYVDNSNGGVNIIVTSASASAVTVTVTKGTGTTATTTGLASSLNPANAGGTVTFTATVTGTNPGGTVNFKDGSTSISGCGAVAVSGSGNSRTAACATSTLGAGAHSVTAAYGGDATNAASTSTVLSETVNKAASTTGLATSLSPSALGASVTFTATVSGSAPTGTVNFKDGGVSISGCSAAAVGGSGNVRTATCATSSLTAGTHSMTAAYSGDGNNNASTSAVLSQVVNGGALPTSLVNAGFESPAVAGYQYNPSGSGVGWTFSTNSGIQANGSAFGAATAPEGKQTAFIQGTSTITQALSLNAGGYTLSFKAAQRSCCVTPYAEPLKVTLDGVQVGSLASPASTSFATFSVAFSVATSGTHTIAFAGTVSGDRTTFLDAVTLTSSTVTVVNPGFEIPSLTAGTYQYRPTATGIGWTFTGNSGIESNGSAWGAATAPDGKQAAMIQGLGSFQQTVTMNAGNHTLSFKAAQRASCCVAPYVQPVKVTLDGVQIGGLVSPTSASFASYSIAFSVATTGAHTITFAGTDSADKTTFIDSVSIQ